MVEVEEVKAACYVEGMPGEREYAFTWWTKVAIPRVNDYMERGEKQYCVSQVLWLENGEVELLLSPVLPM